MVALQYQLPWTCKITYSIFWPIFNCGTDGSTSPNFEPVYLLISSQTLSSRLPTMSFLFILICLVVSVAAGDHYLYGPQWGWYNVSPPKRRIPEYILSAETTLTPGAPPTHVAARLALWPGMNTNTGLVQPIIVNAAEDLFRGS
jgi:hypothetical protein